jgi:alpha-ribazole phosphatase
MHLILLYHGDTIDSAGRCIGRTDVNLSPAGRQTMTTLAAQWPYPPATALISSSRQRSHASLLPFARRFGRLPHVDARLDEQDFGAWEDQPWAQLYQEHGADLQARMTDWVHGTPPGGESFDHMARRCADWLDSTVAGCADDDIVLVASHAGPLRALACHALAIPLLHALLLRADHGHVSALRRQRNRFELCYWNASRFEASLFGDSP